MDEIVKELTQKLSAVTSAIKQELMGIRGNRPTPQLVENIKVDYMEGQFAIKQLGTIGVIPPREIVITLWDAGAVGPVSKALENSPLHATPHVDGITLRVNTPPLTDERREEIIKLVKSIVEKAKIRVRGERDEANKKIERNFAAKLMSEDQKFKGKKKIQEEVDKINKEMDSLLENKSKEINE